MAKGKRKRRESTSSNSSSPQSDNSDTQGSFSRKGSSSASHSRSRSKERRTQADNEADRVTREISSNTITLLQQSLVNFKRISTTNFATEKVVKRLKHNTHDFKFKGNKEQFSFNSVFDSLQECPDLKDNETRMKTVKTAIKSLQHRNKLIKLADNSTAGSELIAEYQTNDEASDSEDNKWILRAEKLALRKKQERSY